MTEKSSLENKELEILQPAQMNIYQSNTCIKNLGSLHSDVVLRVKRNIKCRTKSPFLLVIQHIKSQPEAPAQS